MADIEYLAGVFESLIGRAPKFSAECADGLTRGFDHLDELFAFENADPQRIRALTIQSSSNTQDISARVTFETDSDALIWIHLEGPEDTVSALSERVENRINAMRPWFGPLASFNAFVVFMVLLFVFLGAELALALFRSWAGTVRFRPSTPDDLANGFANGAVLGVAPITLAWVFNKFRDRVFPIGQICIGHGVQRKERLDNVRNIVVLGFIISGVSSLAVGLALK